MDVFAKIKAVEESDLKISYSVHCYDKDGDIYDEGIFIWINNDTSIRVGALSDLESMIKQLIRIEKEIAFSHGEI